MNLAKRYIVLCLVLACAPVLAGAKKHKKQHAAHATHKVKKNVKNNSQAKQPAHKKEPLRQELDVPFAYLMDADTQEMIYDKQGNERLEPASMTKILTAYIVMDYIKNGHLKEEQLLTVSESAFQREGTTMFLNLGQQVKVIDLLKGLVIHSGNDAAAVLAEGIAGSEAEFAKIMNQYAEK
ncbi:MAG: serine hydrolase, partial [Alphaproteobacteria bacterium]|nr:serine hydrolase [Alphaproteobacteria bacterium]